MIDEFCNLAVFANCTLNFSASLDFPFDDFFHLGEIDVAILDVLCIFVHVADIVAHAYLISCPYQEHSGHIVLESYSINIVLESCSINIVLEICSINIELETCSINI